MYHIAKGVTHFIKQLRGSNSTAIWESNSLCCRHLINYPNISTAFSEIAYYTICVWGGVDVDYSWLYSDVEMMLHQHCCRLSS